MNDTFLEKKTEESATVMTFVDGKERVFPVKLKL